MAIDYTPSFVNYTGQGKFRFWCQSVLPLVYDDSLSYMELLNKMVIYLNKTIQDVAAVETNVDALLNAYNQLQEYVNDYFDNLDVQDEINVKLDGLVEDGTMSELIQPFIDAGLPGLVETNLPGVVEEQIPGVVAEQLDDVVESQIGSVVASQIPGEVTDWLNENVDPVGSAVVVDKTLTIDGAAADAKITGEKISAIASEVANTSNEINSSLYEKINDATYNEFVNSANWHTLSNTMLANNNYKIILTLNGFTDADLNKLRSIATYSGQSSSNLVDYLYNVTTGVNLFGEIAGGIPISCEYTPSSNCRYVAINLLSSYSSNTNTSTWIIYDTEENNITKLTELTEEHEERIDALENEYSELDGRTTTLESSSATNNLTIENLNTELSDAIYTKQVDTTFNEFVASSAYHPLGVTLFANRHYKIYLKLNNFDANSIRSLRSISTFSAPSGSNRVDYLYNATEGINYFGNISADSLMVCDYTPSANCSYVSLGFLSGYSSDVNTSSWIIYDAAESRPITNETIINSALLDANRVDYSKYTVWEWVIGPAPTYYWRTGNAYTVNNNSYVIPVGDAEIIEIYASKTAASYYALLNSANPSANVSADFAGGTARRSISANGHVVLDNTVYNAKYLYVLRRDSDYHDNRPFDIVLYTHKTNVNNEIDDLKAKLANANQLAYGLISVGSTGSEIPQNEGTRNAISRVYYAKNVPWVAQGVIPLNSGSPIANLQPGAQTGLLYSSVKEKCKFIGWNVSFKTFFTAAHNPYSLLYTENVSAANSTSDYGFTYHGTNCASYFGIVCSTLIQIATNNPVYWSSREYVYLRRKGMVIGAHNNNASSVRIGTLLPERGHIAIITGVVHNDDGTPSDITLVETYYNHPVEKHYTEETLNTRIIAESERVVYYPELYSVPALEEFDAINYQYNDDICTYAGDDACFYEGEPVWINYTLGNYTGMEIYKNNTLIATVNLSTDANLHKVDVSSYCAEYGDYKARLIGNGNSSEYTNWIVVETNVTCTNNNGILTVNFSSHNSTPTFVQLCYQNGDSRGVKTLTTEDIGNGYVTYDPTALLMEQYAHEYSDKTISGNRFKSPTYARVFFDCGKGVVCNNFINCDTGLYTES